METIVFTALIFRIVAAGICGILAWRISKMPRIIPFTYGPIAFAWLCFAIAQSLSLLYIQEVQAFVSEFNQNLVLVSQLCFTLFMVGHLIAKVRVYAALKRKIEAQDEETKEALWNY